MSSVTGIRLEYLKWIRNAKLIRNFRHSLNSRSFHQLEQIIGCRTRLHGIPVVYVDPHHTSKECSRCDR
jgi:IS605 OrfB family transposase